MPTYDIPPFNDFLDGESSTVRSKLNTNFDHAEAYLQGIEDRLEETESALHLDGVIWKRPEDVADLVVSAGTGLSVNLTAGEALIGFRLAVDAKTNDGGTGGAITNGATNYCYLMQDGTLYFNTTGTPPTSQRNILLAKVVASGGAVISEDNYSIGVVRGIGQPSLRAFTCTATEAVRDAVYVSAANTVAQAQSDDAAPAKARVVGIILAKESATSCIVGTDGAVIGGFMGLTVGSAYYLQTTAGALGTGKPTAPDPIVPVGIAVSTTAMLVKVFLDEAQLSGGGGGAHAESHEVGGSDPVDGNLDANARVAARRNSSATTYKRRRLNFIEGTGINIGVSDDAAEEEVEVSIASVGTAAHEATHESGGADELPLGDLAGSLTNAQHGTLSGGDHSGDLTGNARVGVRKNTAGTTYKRRRINLVEGTNIGITVADDAGDEEVDVTIAATGSLGAHAESHQTGGEDEVYYGQLERANDDATLHDDYVDAPHISAGLRDEVTRPDGNMCPDPGFESADSTVPLWGKMVSGSGVTPVQSAARHKQGRCSCKLSLGTLTEAADYSQITSELVPVPDESAASVGVAIWYRFWLQSANGTEYVKAYLDWNDNTKVPTTSTTIKDGVVGSSWALVEGWATVPTATRWCSLRIKQTDDGTAGDVYVDAVELRVCYEESRKVEIYPDSNSGWVADGTNNNFGTAADSGTSEGWDGTNKFFYVQVKNNGGDATADIDLYAHFQVPFDFFSLTNFKFWSQTSIGSGNTKFEVVEILDPAGAAVTTSPASPIDKQNTTMTQDTATVSGSPAWTKGGRVTVHLKLFAVASGTHWVRVGPIEMNYTASVGR